MSGTSRHRGLGEGYRVVTANAARECIASALREPAADATLGGVVLRPHQRVAVTRIRRALREFRGAILADEPGLGKSYVALAVASAFEDALLVCPASLRPTWAVAMRAADVRLRVATQEALSRGRQFAPPSLVIVDEAHHFRNAATRRYRTLAAIAADARLLMLTATPVHNRPRELGALIALFRGRALVDDDVLSRCVIRRTHADTIVGSLPAVEPTRGIDVDDGDDGTVERIAALPPPLPLGDGGDAAALVRITLLRQWASSAAALRGGLRRHLARSDAVLDALAAGRLPTRRELGSWTIGDDAMQLAFPELVTSRDVASARLIEGARRHRDAVADLRAAVDATPVDERRVTRLHDVLRCHTGARVLCFSQFEETVRMYWRSLRRLPGTCALTAGGADVAGGTLGRADALARFAPLANGARRPGRAEEIRILLTTDLLSEGVNLQDASVVVHLDLPWTPARLEQRIGRVARLGSPHARVRVYEIRSPRAVAAVLALEGRMRAKSGAAMRARAAADDAERVARLLDVWRSRCRSPVPPDAPVVASVRASTGGWLALVGDAGIPRLVASAGAGRGTAPSLLAQACEVACGTDVEYRADHVSRALEELEGWLATERAAVAAGVRDGAHSVRRPALQAVARTASAPRARRAPLEALSAAAWRAAAAPMSLGREGRLRAAGHEGTSESEWLAAVGKLNEDNLLADTPDAGPPVLPRLLALIVFAP